MNSANSSNDKWLQGHFGYLGTLCKTLRHRSADRLPGTTLVTTRLMLDLGPYQPNSRTRPETVIAVSSEAFKLQVDPGVQETFFLLTES